MAYATFPIDGGGQQTTTENYVGDILLGDIHKPENFDKYIRRYGLQMDPIDIFMTLGQVKTTTNKTYSHREGGRMHDYMIVSGTPTDHTAAGAGNAIRVTLASAQHTNSGTLSYPRIYDEVKLKTGERCQIVGKDTGVAATTQAIPGITVTAGSLGGATSGHVFLIYPKRSTDNITSTGNRPASGDNIMIYSNSVEPMSSKRTGITPDAIKYTNTVKEIRDDIDVDPLEMNSVAWIGINNPETGESGAYWYLESQFQTYWRYRQAVHGSLLWDDQNTNTTLTNLGIKGTEGLEKFIRGAGLNHTWVPGAWTRDDFDTISKYQTQNGGTLESTFFMGFDLFNQAERALKTELENSNVSYASFGAGGKDLAVKIGFTSVTLNNFTYHMKRFQTFNDPKLGGVSGFNYMNKGFLVPMGNQMVTVEDSSTESMPYLTVRKLNSNKKSNIDKEHWIVPPKQYNDRLVWTASYHCVAGLHCHSGNKFAWITD